MKKFGFVLVLTVFLSLGVFFTPVIYVSLLPDVSVAKLSEKTYTDYVCATGEVTSPDQKTVYSEMPMIIDKVSVKEGTVIKKGQTIATVNREQTAKKMMLLNQYSYLADMGAGVTITDYKSILDMIPSKIVSGYDGQVQNVNVSDNGYVAMDSEVITLKGTKPLMIKSCISENNISRVKVGQNVIISGKGFGNKKYAGSVSQISDTAQKQYSGTTQETVIEVMVSIDNADETIKSGYTASLKICVSDEETVNIIPYEAVGQDSTGNEYVYVFSDGIAVKKSIETGKELSDGVEIVNGLTKSDNVLAPQEKIVEGDYVKVVK